MNVPDAAAFQASTLSAEQPWPGLQSYGEADSAWFHGRENETAELLRLVRRETLSVLFGQSGQGKTSLLQAGLFPYLRQEDCLPVYIRLELDDEAATLTEQIGAAIAHECGLHHVEAPPLGPGQSLWEYFQHRDCAFWSPRSRLLTPVLVFDQFEEIFTLGRLNPSRRAACDALLAELGDLIENRSPASLRARLEAAPELADEFDDSHESVKIIFTFREDYLADFDILHDYIRARSRNRLRLTPMHGERALSALLEAGQHLLDTPMAEHLVRAVTDDAASPLPSIQVEPALLSLFCRELNARRLAAGHAVFTSELLLDDSAGQIIAGFYANAFAGLDPRVRNFVEDRLLTSDGHRDSCALENALSSPGMTSKAIQALIDRRLLRREERGQRVRLELVHDVLATPAAISRAKRIHAEQLAHAEREAEQNRRRMRKMVVFSGVMACLAIVMAGLSWMAWSAKNEASQQRNDANRQRIDAESSRLKSQKSQELAEREAKRAELEKSAAILAEKRAVESERRAKAARDQAIATSNHLASANKALKETNEKLALRDTEIAERNRQADDPEWLELRAAQRRIELKKKQDEELAAAKTKLEEQVAATKMRQEEQVAAAKTRILATRSPADPASPQESLTIQNALDSKRFRIASEIRARYPSLVTLIINTESMDDEEKQYWFDLLPSMQDNQTKKLFEILETEKIKLAEIEAKYQEEISSLNDKHKKEWEELKKAEAKAILAKWEKQFLEIRKTIKESNPDSYANAALAAEKSLEILEGNDSTAILEARAKTMEIIAMFYKRSKNNAYKDKVTQYYKMSLGILEILTNNNKLIEHYVDSLGNMSWHTLLENQFSDSLEYSTRAIGIDPRKIWIRTNQAHALALLGRSDEARATYEKYWNRKNVSNGMSFSEAVLDDLKAFKKAGIPDDKIKLIETLIPRN